MEFEQVTRKEARRMARSAGLNEMNIRNCRFREGMAQHAVELLISITLKSKELYDNRGQKMLTASAAATKA